MSMQAKVFLESFSSLHVGPLQQPDRYGFVLQALNYPELVQEKDGQRCFT